MGWAPKIIIIKRYVLEFLSSPGDGREKKTNTRGVVLSLQAKNSFKLCFLFPLSHIYVQENGRRSSYIIRIAAVFAFVIWSSWKPDQRHFWWTVCVLSLLLYVSFKKDLMSLDSLTVKRTAGSFNIWWNICFFLFFILMFGTSSWHGDLLLAPSYVNRPPSSRTPHYGQKHLLWEAANKWNFCPWPVRIILSPGRLK